MSKQIDPSKRIEFLAKKFDIFDNDDINALADKDFYLDNGEKYQHLYEVQDTGENTLYAIYTFNGRLLRNEGKHLPNNIRVADFVFIDIVQADPTPHKEYVQWMLETFTRLIKLNEYERAMRFVIEDLWLASEYLTIFDNEKHKPTFKQLCSKNEAFKNISDPSNINQYRDLSQLFDAVDPYIEKNVTELEKDIRIMVRLREGVIPYEDRQVIIFNPTTVKSSRLFKNFTSWCTTASKTSFKNYVDDKTSLGKKSKLYVVIYKTFLLAEDDPNKTNELYQLHFESGSFMDRKDARIADMSKLIEDNVGLTDYFYEELISLAKANKDNYQSNKYVDALMKFGFTNVIFEVLPANVTQVRVSHENLVEIPDISKFADCTLLYLFNCNLKKIHPSVGDLKTLEIISFGENKIESLPNTIGNLTNLRVLNIKGNRIMELPESIKKLDKSNGGSLEVISIDEELRLQVMELLPNVKINQFQSLVNK